MHAFSGRSAPDDRSAHNKRVDAGRCCWASTCRTNRSPGFPNTPVGKNSHRTAAVGVTATKREGSANVALGSSGVGGTARDAGQGFVRSPIFEALARAGFIARGVVYGIIGFLALRLALGEGGKITNQQGALHTVAHQPFGKFLLILVAIGLGGYSLWRLIRASIGHGPEGSDSGVDRVAAAASGLVYGAMCYLAVEILSGSNGGGAGNAPKTTAGVLGWPGGTWIVGIAGAVMIGVAAYQGYRGVTRDSLDDSKTAEMGRRTKEWIGAIGTVGHLARMVVFGLVGVFLIKAAVDSGPVLRSVRRRARQTAPSQLRRLHARIVAGGLVAFGLYSLSDARYRKI